MAKNIHPYCLLYHFLKFDAESITYDLGYPSLSLDEIRNIEIPTYSEKQQRRIIKDIGEMVSIFKQLKEKHQNIMDGYDDRE